MQWHIKRLRSIRTSIAGYRNQTQSSQRLTSKRKRPHRRSRKRVARAQPENDRAVALHSKRTEKRFLENNRWYCVEQYAKMNTPTQNDGVLRVWVDGRPDELVRGVDLIGTPLEAFSKIVRAGELQRVFNGNCGAESGWVPVSAVSPSLLLESIETQRKRKDQETPPLLPPPLAKEAD